MNRLLALAEKELRDILRERSILLAILVQLFVAAFSGFLTLGLVSFYDPESAESHPPSTVAYVGPGGFDRFLEQAGNLRLEKLPLPDAIAGFQSGRIHAVVEETYASTNGTRTVTLLLPEQEIRTTLLVTQLKGLLSDYERQLRLDRADRIQGSVVYVSGPDHANPYYGFAYSVLLPLLVMSPVFLSGAIVGDSFTQEIETRTFHLLRASPLSARELLVGKLLVPVLLVPAQVSLWILLLKSNGFTVAHVPSVLFLGFLLSLLLASAGTLVALLLRAQGQTQAAYALLVLVLIGVSVIMPREPMNLIARFGTGSSNLADTAVLGLYAVLSSVVFLLALWATHHRMRLGDE